VRIFGIPASEADVVAVVRRGPSGWSHLGRWDVVQRSYQPGAWLHGTLYPQRCDVSPDGCWFLGFVVGAARPGWAPGNTYVALSRLPWLAALAAWGTGGTWSRGVAFTDRSVNELGTPDVGDVARLPFGLSVTRAASFAVERRRGWQESDDTPPRGDTDVWDEQRSERVRMEKRQPGGTAVLAVAGTYAAFRSGQPGPVRYCLDGTLLPDVQWADWSRDGRLLVATTSGRLEIRDARGIAWASDLSAFTPDPQPAPPEALRW
jgi:hypothetical protein